MQIKKETTYRLVATIIAVVVAIFSYTTSYSQQKGDVFITISKYIQKGDYEKISLWFADNIEIELLGDQISCSNHQATHILKNFFANHQPQSFKMLHKSGNPNMRYAIGELQCVNGEGYKIIILMRNLQNSSAIVRLRIEKD